MQFLTPLSRQVIQRGNNNAAQVNLTGTYSTTTEPAKIRVRLVAIVPTQGVSTDWQECPFSAGQFSAKLVGRGGWYRIEAEALTAYNVAQETATVDRFGIGEVFCVAGHSVAQGGADYINGTADDRVSVIPLDTPVDQTRHVQTGLLEDMPPIKFVQFGTGIRPAPFGPSNYFWSDFGGKLAARLNVPVLIYQTAFGGTNLEQWAKSAQGTDVAVFNLAPGLRFPYVNLKHVLQRYVPLTGIRALLIDHGQNDYQEKSADVLLARYRQLVDQARSDSKQPYLAAVINRQTPYLTVDAGYKGGDGPQTQVRQMQERMAATSNCWPGPDYDTGLLVADRTDYIHLSLSGQTKAAQLWESALTDSFFRQSIPVVIDPVTAVLPAALTDLPAAPLTSGTTSPLPATSTPGTVPSGATAQLTDERPTAPASRPSELTRLSNLAAIGLVMLGLASLAYLFHRAINRPSYVTP
ncbi:hypothetical protein GCM10027578_22340 [Spirosoma luteolum]